MDSGFTRSDVTYDVVAVWNGKFFRLQDHLNRFERGWKRLRMNPELSVAQMREILFECVRRSGLRNAYVEMIISRGLDEEGSRDPRRFRNRFYAYAIPYVWIGKPGKITALIRNRYWEAHDEERWVSAVNYPTNV